ncbi:hypothetical protein EYW49_20295 [Siculibacillus lacustris]|uniref:DNA-directed DNA polymerase family A palm domain-containing protein n=1 Tax=Siculibacillus lacustris TaxID=1549641 RepID=A0A4Q9VEZ4_9HYPH|nr:hypothetical protein [Siculibacillus lacustris]TBW33409.1 hypothetical protein EYW49_20295 [Siculibacillus lacustris]
MDKTWGQRQSDRDLVYRRIELVEDEDGGRDNITYLGVNQLTKKWGPVRTYGGKIVENITQAVARDILGDALLEFEDQGIETVLTIHDEALAAAPIAAAVATLRKMLAIMARPPKWAPGLPVGGAGWIGPRYKKA